MPDVPVELIVAAFQDEESAKAALEELKKAKKDGLIAVEGAAVLRKDAKGKLHITETEDIGGGKGAAFGGVVGAGIGLIAGAALAAPLAIGALIGGLASKLRDTGFSNERLEKLGSNLTPGSSAIVAVVEHTWVKKVEDALAKAGADALTEQLGADIADQLDKGHQVAYDALVSNEGLLASRVAGGDDEIDASSVLVDDSGLTASQFVATENGFVVRTADVTDVSVDVMEMDAEVVSED
ncbi:MAG TPA: DUF1269 domain-containing protein [Acidimicrobiia bacterium]